MVAIRWSGFFCKHCMMVSLSMLDIGIDVIDDNLRLAIDRDVTFFRHIMAFNNRGRQSPP